ncbi:MAG: hypothetical protein CMQ24_14745 [Gammaproteobacteria bacterium]|nr:hypothetical protein [Gammaproteobacteria bacterium]
MAGGRVGLFFNERKGEVGATLVKDQMPGREQQLAGVDVTYKFAETTELRAEYAETESASQAGICQVQPTSWSSSTSRASWVSPRGFANRKQASVLASRAAPA